MCQGTSGEISGDTTHTANRVTESFVCRNPVIYITGREWNLLRVGGVPELRSDPADLLPMLGGQGDSPPLLKLLLARGGGAFGAPHRVFFVAKEQQDTGQQQHPTPETIWGQGTIVPPQDLLPFRKTVSNGTLYRPKVVSK